MTTTTKWTFVDYCDCDDDDDGVGVDDANECAIEILRILLKFLVLKLIKKFNTYKSLKISKNFKSIFFQAKLSFSTFQK